MADNTLPNNIFYDFAKQVQEAVFSVNDPTGFVFDSLGTQVISTKGSETCDISIVIKYRRTTPNALVDGGR